MSALAAVTVAPAPATHAAAPRPGSQADNAFASFLDALPRPKDGRAAKDAEAAKQTEDSETGLSGTEARAALENALSLAFPPTVSPAPPSLDAAAPLSDKRTIAPSAETDGVGVGPEGSGATASAGASRVAGASLIAERAFHAASFDAYPASDTTATSTVAASIAAQQATPARAPLQSVAGDGVSVSPAATTSLERTAADRETTVLDAALSPAEDAESALAAMAPVRSAPQRPSRAESWTPRPGRAEADRAGAAEPRPFQTTIVADCASGSNSAGGRSPNSGASGESRKIAKAASNAASPSGRGDSPASGPPSPSVATPAGVDPVAAIVASLAQLVTPETSTENASPAASAIAESPSRTLRFAGPVREIDVDLAPGSLDPLSMTMRLAGDRLSVVIRAGSGESAHAIESARDAIAERLTAIGQPLASLVIQQTGASGQTTHAQDSSNDSREQSQSDDRNPEQDPHDDRRGDASRRR